MTTEIFQDCTCHECQLRRALERANRTIAAMRETESAELHDLRKIKAAAEKWEKLEVKPVTEIEKSGLVLVPVTVVAREILAGRGPEECEK